MCLIEENFTHLLNNRPFCNFESNLAQFWVAFIDQNHTTEHLFWKRNISIWLERSSRSRDSCFRWFCCGTDQLKSPSTGRHSSFPLPLVTELLLLLDFYDTRFSKAIRSRHRHSHTDCAVLELDFPLAIKMVCRYVLLERVERAFHQFSAHPFCLDVYISVIQKISPRVKVLFHGDLWCLIPAKHKSFSVSIFICIVGLVGREVEKLYEFVALRTVSTISLLSIDTVECECVLLRRQSNYFQRSI